MGVHIPRTFWVIFPWIRCWRAHTQWAIPLWPLTTNTIHNIPCERMYIFPELFEQFFFRFVVDEHTHSESWLCVRHQHFVRLWANLIQMNCFTVYWPAIELTRNDQILIFKHVLKWSIMIFEARRDSKGHILQECMIYALKIDHKQSAPEGSRFSLGFSPTPVVYFPVFLLKFSILSPSTSIKMKRKC